MKGSKGLIDKMLIMGSLGYVIIPIILFAYGWLKPYYTLVIMLLLVAFFLSAFRSLCVSEYNIVSKATWKYWVTVVLILGLWVYMSGIGGFSYQNSDFWMRNPLYRDLCDYNWPVIYDLSLEPESVQTIMGTNSVMFSYYFCWWLVPAFLSKILHLSDLGRNIILYVYALLGICLVIYNICRYFKKITYLIPIIFIFFSGMDVIGYWIKTNTLPFIEHIEWWSKYFQFTSNTSQLYWVFNQSIPVWIITVLLLQMNGNMIPAIASLSFAYSPWATFGFVPIVLGAILGKNKRIKDSITWENIAAYDACGFGAFLHCWDRDQQRDNRTYL